MGVAYVVATREARVQVSRPMSVWTLMMCFEGTTMSVSCCDKQKGGRESRKGGLYAPRQARSMLSQ